MSKKGTIDKKEEISNLYKDLAALRPTEDFEPVQEDYDKAVKVHINFKRRISNLLLFMVTFNQLTIETIAQNQVLLESVGKSSVP